LVPVSTIRPRAVRDVCSLANTGKSYSRASSTSRVEPSTTTPATPRSLAPSDRLPPQPAASMPVRCSMTMTSPGWAPSTAAVLRCRDATGRPSSGSSFTVVTRPEMRRSVAKR
jgi:hypothetical protein